MLTDEQKKIRSRNYLRYKVIMNQAVNLSYEFVDKGIVTQDEYAELREINLLQTELQSARIIWLSKYRDNCDKLGVPKPPERKPITKDIIDPNSPF